MRRKFTKKNCEEKLREDKGFEPFIGKKITRD